MNATAASNADTPIKVGRSVAVTPNNRFAITRVSAQELRYEFTVADETTWVRPWTAMIPLQRSREPIFEYACHEGNLGLAGILTGSRAEEQAEKSVR